MEASVDCSKYSLVALRSWLFSRLGDFGLRCEEGSKHYTSKRVVTEALSNSGATPERTLFVFVMFQDAEARPPGILGNGQGLKRLRSSFREAEARLQLGEAARATCLERN